MLYLKHTAVSSAVTLDEIAEAIKINKDTVLKALGYFEAMSDASLSFIMDDQYGKESTKTQTKVRRMSVRTAKKEPVKEYEEDLDYDEDELPNELSEYKHYHSELQAIFGAKELSRSDYEKADEWIEVYGLPMETAIYLASYMVSSKGEKISFAYIAK